MIDVSQLWLDNQRNNFVSESFIKISFDTVDPNVLHDASFSSTGQLGYSSTNDIIIGNNRDIEYYATLETNFWLLDGSRKVLPTSDTVVNNGYISEQISNQNGMFDEPILITIEFSQTQKSPLNAITITWTNSTIKEYAVEYIIRLYREETLLKEVIVEDNKDISSILMFEDDPINYDKITIEINKWCLSQRHARILDIVLGLHKIYDKNDLLEYTHTLEVDPISAIVPKSEMKISLDNTDNMFDPNNERGLYHYLSQRKMFKVEYGYKLGDVVEWIPAGEFYLSEWTTPQNGISADFTARDVLEFMNDVYIKGVYVTQPKTLYDLAVDVLESANLPRNDDNTVKWKLSDTLKNYSTVAPLPLATHAECLQYIAQAGKCMLYVDRTGTINIEPSIVDSSQDTDYHISRFNSFSYPEITLLKPLKSVNTRVYSYKLYQRKNIYDGTIDFGDEPNTRIIQITYSNTATNITSTITGDDVAYDPAEQVYYSNSCLLKITAKGKVDIVIEGDIFENTTNDYVLVNSDEGEEQIVDNPLITTQEWAKDVSEWVRDWLTLREQLTANWRADPRLDASDTVKIDNKYTTDKMKVTSIEYKYNGYFSGTSKGRIL